MSSRGQPKPCDTCLTPVEVRYRIQYDESGTWHLVCPQCWHHHSRDNPYYRYGGTWKSRKKH